MKGLTSVIIVWRQDTGRYVLHIPSGTGAPHRATDAVLGEAPALRGTLARARAFAEGARALLGRPGGELIGQRAADVRGDRRSTRNPEPLDLVGHHQETARGRAQLWSLVGQERVGPRPDLRQLLLVESLGHRRRVS